MMKGSDFKPNEKTITLLDGKHKIAIDFNAFAQLEEIYGDMQTAFNKFSPKNDDEEDGQDKPSSVKFADIKNFLCAGINACIKDTEDHLTSFQIGKLLDISKLTEYVTVLMKLITTAMPNKKPKDDEDKDEVKN